MTGLPWTIPQRDADKLLTDGFMRIEQGLPPELLRRWRDLTDRLEAEAVAEYRQDGRAGKACVVERGGVPRAYRIDDIIEHDAEAVLDLLACPAVMAVATQLSGPGTVPLNVDVVYKHPYPYPHIIWHQGAAHPRTHPYLNVGVYLDDADAGDGCLKYLPGTQHALLDIGALEVAHGWNPPGAVEFPAKAGDILVQDMMVLHCSEPKRTPGARRTVYIEFRPAESVRQQGSQSAAWVDFRERWMALVLDRADPACRPASGWPEIADLQSVEAEVAAMQAAWEPPVPAHYATFPTRHPDYPTPADLRHLDAG